MLTSTDVHTFLVHRLCCPRMNTARTLRVLVCMTPALPRQTRAADTVCPEFSEALLYWIASRTETRAMHTALWRAVQAEETGGGVGHTRVVEFESLDASARSQVRRRPQFL
jgi:hypothetical protein